MTVLPESLQPMPRGPERLLLVDPEGTRLEELSEFFVAEGFEVCSVDDPSNVLSEVASSLPDVVLLDVNSDGIQTCRQLRVTPVAKLTPVILMAGKEPDEHTIVRALTCGADDYVGSGASMAELKARVSLQLRNRRDRELLTEALNRGNQYKDEAHTDPLTRLPNRRAADRELERRFGNGGVFALLMIDIDSFKSINDRFGHGVGDQVLETLAATLERACRDQEFCARMGGEEFLLLAEAEDQAAAEQAAERVRSAVENTILSRDIPVDRITVSVGATLVNPKEHDAFDAAALVESADRALYQAKDAGRNCVAFSESS